MYVDFGYIEDYNPATGFGHVTLTINPSKEFVQFQKTQVWNWELSDRLEKKSFRGVRIWYCYETEDAIHRIIETWYSPDDIDEEIKNIFLSSLEPFWENIEKDKPNWLDGVTKLIGGLELHGRWNQKRSDKNQIKYARIKELEEQEVARKAEIVEKIRLNLEELAKKAKSEEERRIKEIEHQRKCEMEKRSVEIRNFCERRNFHTLVHFTRIENLTNILLYGLVSREKMAEMKLLPSPVINDHQRFDKLLNGISLSISFPNYRMFFSYTQGQFEKWVILFLDPSILWKLDCGFNSQNAASSSMQRIPLEDRKKPDTLYRMFDDVGDNKRGFLKIPDNFPTDPQAEVLVFETIPTCYLQNVHFLNMNSLSVWKQQNPTLWQSTFTHCMDYVCPRVDYKFWTKTYLGNDRVIPQQEFLDSDMTFPDGYVPDFNF